MRNVPRRPMTMFDELIVAAADDSDRRVGR
jgi:hypothetical protein